MKMNVTSTAFDGVKISMTLRDDRDQRGAACFDRFRGMESCARAEVRHDLSARNRYIHGGKSEIVPFKK